MNTEVKKYDSGEFHHVTVITVAKATPRDILALKTACVEFVKNGHESEISREMDKTEEETVVVFRSDSGVAQLRFSSDHDTAHVLTIDHDSPPRQLRIPSND
jgi:hypothetical protein